MTDLFRTPLTRLGDAAERRVGPAAGYIASSVVAVGAAALLIGWLVAHGPRHALWWPALLLTVLTAATPGLIRHWEARFARLLTTLRAHEKGTGWDLPRIHAAIRRVDAWYWPFTFFAFGFAALFFIFFATPGLRRLGVDDAQGRAAAAVVAGAFAYSVGVGQWIVARTVTIVAAALNSPPHWRPFRRRQRTGIEALSALAAFTGMTISVGSLAVPAWMEAGRDGPLGARVFTGFGTTFFIAMGCVVFLIPQVMLLRFLARARDARIDDFGAMMEQVSDAVGAMPLDDMLNPRRHAQLDRLTRLHSAFAAMDSIQTALRRGLVAPASLHTASRAVTTVVLPIAALVIQALTAS